MPARDGGKPGWGEHRVRTAEGPGLCLHCGWSSKKLSGSGEEGGGECQQLLTCSPQVPWVLSHPCSPSAERVNGRCAGQVALLAVKIHSYTWNTTDCEM